MAEFELGGLHFEYDDEKANLNKAKHQLSFEAAAYVFTDPNSRTQFNCHKDGEDRWETIGWAGPVVIYVIHTDRKTIHGKETIRLISARKATKRERQSYLR